MRRSMASRKAYMLLRGSSRSMPRSRAKWFRVPGRDADERHPALDGDRRDERLRAVAAGHAEAVGAAGDGIAGELLEVEPVVEHHGLDAELVGQLDEPELLDLARRPTTGCRSAPGGSGGSPRADRASSRSCRSRTTASRADPAITANRATTSADPEHGSVGVRAPQTAATTITTRRPPLRRAPPSGAAGAR